MLAAVVNPFSFHMFFISLSSALISNLIHSASVCFFFFVSLYKVENENSSPIEHICRLLYHYLCVFFVVFDMVLFNVSFFFVFLVCVSIFHSDVLIALVSFYLALAGFCVRWIRRVILKLLVEPLLCISKYATLLAYAILWSFQCKRHWITKKITTTHEKNPIAQSIK